MTDEVALYETDGAIAVITMNRPDKRNALNGELKEALVALFRRAESDDEIAVVVLRGAGRSFCAGADISPDPGREARRGDALRTHAHHMRSLEFQLTPWQLAKPVVASIQGHAMGAGCELAMMCDISIAADTALFGEPEIRFAAIGSALIMPWMVGHKRARQLLYLGDSITAERAERIGMVNLVVPAAELETETIKFARRLALVGRETLGAIKMAVNRGIEAQGFHDALRSGVAVVSMLATSQTESDGAFRKKVEEDGPAAAFRWRNDQFRE